MVPCVTRGYGAGDALQTARPPAPNARFLAPLVLRCGQERDTLRNLDERLGKARFPFDMPTNSEVPARLTLSGILAFPGQAAPRFGAVNLASLPAFPKPGPLSPLRPFRWGQARRPDGEASGRRSVVKSKTVRRDR